MEPTDCSTRVCICSEFPPPYGGIGMQAMLLADSLESDSCFAVCRLSNTLPENRVGRFLNKIKGVRGVVRTLLFLVNCFRFFPQIKIVHILSGSYLNFFLYTAPAIFIGKLNRASIIVHYHGGSASNFLATWGVAVRPLLKWADKMIVPSGFLQDVFLEHGLESVIIPNIITLESFRFKNREEFLPKILMTRHLEPIYNISCAVRGFSLLLKEYPDAVLTVAGDGSEKEKLLQITHDLGCAMAVNFLGAVNSEAIHHLYEEHDILLNTSNVDNLPLSLLEGLACGLIVVSTKSGGIPYVIKDAENGLLIDIDDSKAVAAKISWALSHQDEARQLVSHGAETVTSFSWEQVKPLLINLYGQLCN